MAIATSDKFLGVSASVDTEEKRSKYHDDRSSYHTMGDITQFIINSGLDALFGDLNTTGDLIAAGGLSVTSDATVGTINLRQLGTTVNQGRSGAIGEIVISSDYIYVCTAIDTWKRVALTNFS